MDGAMLHQCTETIMKHNNAIVVLKKILTNKNCHVVQKGFSVLGYRLEGVVAKLVCENV